MKRIISLLLSVSIMASFFVGIEMPVFAMESGDFSYEENGDGTVTVNKYKGSGGDVEIPAALDGMPVTEIGYYAFDRCASLTSVTIPDSVTSFGECVFWNCDSLTTVMIGDGVTSIGYGAFENCRSLTSVTIPENVTSIGADAFRGCYSLIEITVDPENPNYSSQDGVLFNNSKTELIQYPSCNTQTVYLIPDGVESICAEAFSNCDSLTSVTIPDSVTTIGDYAFDSCVSLTNATIPDSVTSIGDLCV